MSGTWSRYLLTLLVSPGWGSVEGDGEDGDPTVRVPLAPEVQRNGSRAPFRVFEDLADSGQPVGVRRLAAAVAGLQYSASSRQIDLPACRPGSKRGLTRPDSTGQAAHPLPAGIPHCSASGVTIRLVVNPTGNEATHPRKTNVPDRPRFGTNTGASDTMPGPGSGNTLSGGPTWCPNPRPGDRGSDVVSEAPKGGRGPDRVSELPAGLGVGPPSARLRTPCRVLGQAIPCPGARRGVRTPDLEIEGPTGCPKPRRGGRGPDRVSGLPACRSTGLPRRRRSRHRGPSGPPSRCRC
jgi:hypothetical protein